MLHRVSLVLVWLSRFAIYESLFPVQKNYRFPTEYPVHFDFERLIVSRCHFQKHHLMYVYRNEFD